MPGTVLKTGDRAMNSSECVPKQVLRSPQFMCFTFTLQKLSLLSLHYWYLYFLVLAARLCIMQQGRVDFKSYSPKTLASRSERKFINVSGSVMLGPEEPHCLKKHHGVCFLSTKCTGDISQPSGAPGWTFISRVCDKQVHFLSSLGNEKLALERSLGHLEEVITTHLCVWFIGTFRFSQDWLVNGWTN